MGEAPRRRHTRMGLDYRAGRGVSRVPPSSHPMERPEADGQAGSGSSRAFSGICFPFCYISITNHKTSLLVALRDGDVRRTLSIVLSAALNRSIISNVLDISSVGSNVATQNVTREGAGAIRDGPGPGKVGVGRGQPKPTREQLEYRVSTACDISSRRLASESTRDECGKHVPLLVVELGVGLRLGEEVLSQVSVGRGGASGEENGGGGSSGHLGPEDLDRGLGGGGLVGDSDLGGRGAVWRSERVTSETRNTKNERVQLLGLGPVR